jgi:lipopolysaccharide/colanic/teichoic acid biosynthesis glycosyltransferase
MNISTEKKITLIHSIVWAVLILVLAYLIKGNEQANIIFIFMVGGWYISHASILKQAKAKKSNCDSTKTSTMCCL